MSNIPVFPFRSKSRIKYVTASPNTKYTVAPLVPRYMPKHQRRLTLHHIHGPKTWMMDYMNIDGTHILNIIHCNSRYWLPVITENESVDNALVLLDMIFRGSGNISWTQGEMVIDTLITDAAKAFITSAALMNVCRAYKIKQIAFNMNKEGVQVLPIAKQPTTSQFHNQLSIIDRVSQTLRNMIATIRRSQPGFILNAQNLHMLRDIYNRSPHETLSKTMGFDVTPLQALKYKRLQDELVRRWMIVNYNIMAQPEFDVPIGTLVYLYAPKGDLKAHVKKLEQVPYRIIERRGGAFVIQRVDAPKGSARKIVQRKDFVIPYDNN